MPEMTTLRDADANIGLKEQAVTPLKHRVFRAGGWTLVGHFLSLSLRLISSIILTRIFSPDTFGLLAIITAISTVIALLTDIGVRQSIVRSPNGANPTFLHTAWSVQVLRGILVWGLSLVAAGGIHIAVTWQLLPLHSVYAQPILPVLIVVASFSSVILGFQSMKSITASRDLSLRRVTLIDIFSQFTGLLIVILLGWLTRSIWSYIGGLLLTSLLTVLLGHVWLRGPRDRLGWDKDALHEFRHFGKWVFFTSAIGAAILNGDRILLANWLSPSLLGFYSIANNLAGVPDALANSLFASVAFPTLSEVNRVQPERLSQLFYRIRWLSDSMLLLVAGFLFASGSAIVGLLYDPRYSSAGWMLQWLSFGLVFVRYQVSTCVYFAVGRPNYTLVINVIRTVSIFVLLPILFYTFGLPGVIIGMAFHMVPSTLCFLYFNSKVGIGNLRQEIAVLVVWPVGWLLGMAFDRLIVVTKGVLLGAIS